ncbi:MAG TPA: twin-arginine translocase TatA/TatE family subunit [Kofleriaceae bacterium]|jgi:sec-independent protein translocase protein TatB|nr:twin-arginine translocase TatA/TatE family subunit [Kofleriaceae bacterium]
MFGIGGSEIIVILIVALLFLGPDKLPEAAKTISKGIRDLKKQSRTLQQTIENDERIGGAIRDIKSALRGEEAPPARPKPFKPKPQLTEKSSSLADKPGEDDLDDEHEHAPANGVATSEATPQVTLPPTAGEADPEHPHSHDDDDLGSLVRPAAGTVAKGTAEEPGTKHG